MELCGDCTLVEALSQIIGSFLSLGAIAFFSVAGVRGCAVGVWRSPEKAALYRIAGAEGRRLAAAECMYWLKGAEKPGRGSRQQLGRVSLLSHSP